LTVNAASDLDLDVFLVETGQIGRQFITLLGLHKIDRRHRHPGLRVPERFDVEHGPSQR
jgi:hypothetical protein